MSREGLGVVGVGAPNWRGRVLGSNRLESPPLHAYLFDADDELAECLEMRERFAARGHATARLIEAEPGECALEPWFTTVGEGPGLLILEGLVAVDTRISNRTVTELLGSGDLLQPLSGHADEMIDRVASWRALCPCRLALLDGEFAERVRPWPQIEHALLRRTERRTEDLAMMRAIACQPRLEVRLVLFLWHLAARWGRVEPSGIRLRLPLTHRLLGQLVAAERPSVSHALGRLSQAGLVTGAAGDWHLHGSVDAHLESLIGRATSLAPAGLGPRSAGGQIA